MAFRFSLWIMLVAFAGADRLQAQSLPYRRLLITKVGETPLSGIADLAEDERGFLWLGGAHGLYRYDGASLEVFTNRPDDSSSIVAGPYVQVKKSRVAEVLWLGSNTSGLSYFDLRTERAQNFVADPANPLALAGNEIAGIHEDADGGLWVGTNQFTLHYLPPAQKNKQSRSFQRFRPALPAVGPADFASAGPLGEIIPDIRDPNVLWIGSRYGIYRFNRTDHSFTLHAFDHNVTYWYRPMNLQMLMDPGGALWCGGFATGLCRLDPHTGKWNILEKQNQSPEMLSANSILDIISLDENQLLILTSMDDAWTLDWRQQTAEFLNIGVIQTIGIPYALLRGIHTRDGDIWLVYNEGLIRLTKRDPIWGFVFFPRLMPELNRSNWQRSYAISPDSQSLYVGTLRGNGLLVYQLKTEQVEVFSYRDSRSPEVTDVLMDALCFDATGRCWVGSDTGLLFLDKNNRHIRRYESPSPVFPELRNAQVASLVASGKTLWVGTKGRGLFRVDLTTGAIGRVLADGLNVHTSVNCLLPDSRGRLWVGHEQGLTVYDTITGDNRRFSRRAHPPAGLSNDQVTSLAFDAAGHLWVSTLGGGLLRLRHGDPEHPWFDAFYNNEVPGGNLVYEFVVCDRGQLWLGTQSGLAILDTVTRSFVNYDNRDGMFAKVGAMIRLPDGRIVSAAHRGFHIFHPDTLRHTGLPPVPYLKRFRVFDKEIPLPLQIDRMEELTLQHNQNHCSFELGALNFGEQARTSFAYRLEGYDRDWVYSGTRSYISYTNLPAGTYTLRVKAANKHGIWSEREKNIRIVIRPPYWQTWWFRLIACGVLLALAWILYLAWRQRRRALAAQGAIDYFANADYRRSTVRDILWDVSHKCMARLGLEDCVIYLLDESGEYLVQEAAFGAKSPELYELKDPLRIPLGQGIVGAAGLKGQPELVPDTRRDRRYIVDDQPRLSELAVPILHDGRVIGVIDSEHSKRGFFTERHVQVLKTIASLCADKIVQARAVELVQEKERQLRELNQNLAESQLTALRAQMNPHFLFNCLNSINWYIIKNRPAEASRYIAKFSRLIRLILDHSKNRFITLAQELEALRLYLDMEAMRFEQRFEYHIDVSADLDPEEVMVPPLIFQPYIENAIWHGLMPKNGPGHLSLNLRQEDEGLVCTIQDNGIGRVAASANSNLNTRKRQSQGLKITEARIRQMNGQANGTSPVQFTDLYGEDGQATGTRVEIRIG